MKVPLPLSLFLLLSVMAPVAQAQTWTEGYNKLLVKYVTPAGIKYREWKSTAADMQALQSVVDEIAKENISSLDKKSQLAFYVNAYNAWILHEALEKYPTKSVKDTLYTFFTSKRIKVAGEEMSFNRLEKDIIRPKFGDARIHFALNCASRSCPPLIREAYRGDKIDEQFERVSKGFVNSDKGVLFSAEKKTAELSTIFDWYKDDFKEGVIEFINKRRAAPIPKDAKISYQKYDWDLNEVK